MDKVQTFNIGMIPTVRRPTKEMIPMEQKLAIHVLLEMELSLISRLSRS